MIQEIGNPSPRYLDSPTKNEQELSRVFKMFNINNSGSIDQGELVVALKELGVSTCLYTARRVLESVDLDKSGFIELHDFCKFFAAASNVEEVKHLLSQEALKYINYKANADSGDPNFSQHYKIPTCFSPESRYTLHLDVVQAVAWLNELDFISGSLDGSVAIWTASKSEPVRTFKPAGASIYSMSLTADKRKALVGMAECAAPLAILDITSASLEQTYEGFDEFPVTCTVTHDHSAISGSTSGRCLLHDIARSAPVTKLLESGPIIEAVAFNGSMGGSLVAVGHHSGHISLIDTRFGSKNPTFRFEASLGKVSAVEFRTEHEIISGGDDYLVKVFDTRRLTPLGGAIGCFLGHTSAITSLAVAPNLILSGALDGSVRLWTEPPKHIGGVVKFQELTITQTDDMTDTSSAAAALVGHSQSVKAIAYRTGGAKKTAEILTASSDTCIHRYSVALHTV